MPSFSAKIVPSSSSMKWSEARSCGGIFSFISLSCSYAFVKHFYNSAYSISIILQHIGVYTDTLDKFQLCSFLCIFNFSKPFDSSNILHVFLHHLAKDLAKKQNFVLFQRFGNFFENRGNPHKIRDSKRARRGRRALLEKVFCYLWGQFKGTGISFHNFANHLK